ncbi:MAG: chemotaxis protein CheB [Chloroflexaceae bacterium]
MNNGPHTSNHAEHTPADDQHVEPGTETAQQAHALTDEPVIDYAPAQASDKLFPIVGIGASAGGLEAFEKFFTNMPSDSGIAFILVQHLDPTHESMLVDIIQRYTHMQVMQVTSGMAVQPNCVHIRYGPPANGCR